MECQNLQKDRRYVYVYDMDSGSSFPSGELGTLRDGVYAEGGGACFKRVLSDWELLRGDVMDQWVRIANMSDRMDRTKSLPTGQRQQQRPLPQAARHRGLQRHLPRLPDDHGDPRSPRRRPRRPLRGSRLPRHLPVHVPLSQGLLQALAVRVSQLKQLSLSSKSRISISSA